MEMYGIQNINIRHKTRNPIIRSLLFLVLGIWYQWFDPIGFFIDRIYGFIRNSDWTDVVFFENNAGMCVKYHQDMFRYNERTDGMIDDSQDLYLKIGLLPRSLKNDHYVIDTFHDSANVIETFHDSDCVDHHKTIVIKMSGYKATITGILREGDFVFNPSERTIYRADPDTHRVNQCKVRISYDRSKHWIHDLSCNKNHLISLTDSLLLNNYIKLRNGTGFCDSESKSVCQTIHQVYDLLTNDSSPNGLLTNDLLTDDKTLAVFLVFYFLAFASYCISFGYFILQNVRCGFWRGVKKMWIWVTTDPLHRDGFECPICLDHITGYNDVEIIDDCDCTKARIFHKQCIDQWFDFADRCPYCRVRFNDW